MQCIAWVVFHFQVKAERCSVGIMSELIGSFSHEDMTVFKTKKSGVPHIYMNDGQWVANVDYEGVNRSLEHARIWTAAYMFVDELNAKPKLKPIAKSNDESC